MVDAPLSREERDALTAELALGLLDHAERATALRRLMADPGFAPEQIDAWHERLAPLYDDYRPVPAPHSLWTGIQARIAEPFAERDTVMRRLRLWRGTSVAASTIAASLALMLLFRPTPPVSDPPLAQSAPVAIAQMTGTPAGPVILARYDRVTGQLVLRPSGMETSPLTPELWVIPADGKPRSLGLIAGGSDSRVFVDTPLRTLMQEGATLAVTMESASDAPHAAPSSAPVAVGKISLI
ncbi:anti-sigma factor [Sphingobium sp. CR2-8]|uniref:anti-sigma factor n=1 Tax=Sphingobium sp. CR2-8 TaxID=1306534 RepID=UPI002DBC10AF|nr:anti-sigma factor [Sphingobium sp. CR2-8]MEC3908921.1 anti-sigma factor [Sphingobium sp. CR2-8]